MPANNATPAPSWHLEHVRNPDEGRSGDQRRRSETIHNGRQATNNTDHADPVWLDRTQAIVTRSRTLGEPCMLQGLPDGGTPRRSDPHGAWYAMALQTCWLPFITVFLMPGTRGRHAARDDVSEPQRPGHSVLAMAGCLTCCCCASRIGSGSWQLADGLTSRVWSSAPGTGGRPLQHGTTCALPVTSAAMTNGCVGAPRCDATRGWLPAIRRSTTPLPPLALQSLALDH